MNSKALALCLLLSSVWVAAPVLLAAKGLPYAAESSGAQNSFIHKVQKVEDFASKSHVSSYDGEAFKGSSGDKSSGTGMRSYSDSLGSSFDAHTGAKGDSSSSGPWWDRRASGDPSVKDLSGMDGGGFAPPGSYTGSERRF